MQINNNLLSKNPIAFLSLFLEPSPEVIFSTHNFRTPLEKLSQLYPNFLLPFNKDYTAADFLGNFKKKEILFNQLSKVRAPNISYLYFVYICLLYGGRLPFVTDEEQLILPVEHIQLLKKEFNTKIRDLESLPLLQQFYGLKDCEKIMHSKSLKYFYEQFKKIGDISFNNFLNNRSLKEETKKFSLIEIINAILFTEIDSLITKHKQTLLNNLPILNFNRGRWLLESIDAIVLALIVEWVKEIPEKELVNINFNIDTSIAYSSMELFI